MSRSAELFLAAQEHIPGGVNSPVRAFKGVGGHPIFFKKAQGPYLYDEDDRQYLDFVGSWGPMIAGHAHPQVVAAVQQAAAQGMSFGAPTAIETQMAARVKELVPSIELVRFCSSGTEAAMSALRLARGYTNRPKIVKFEGCYHGHSDSLLVKAGSGALTLGVPTSPGVLPELVAQTVVLPFNDITAVRQTFRDMGAEIACVMVEPVAGNMNCIPPVSGFLEGLREICTEYDSLLIFDEVMTGFRVALGGAQALYGIAPDMTALGKVIGAGMPVAAFGGKRAVMEYLSPMGPVYQAGTLSGNPVAMAAGLANLEIISAPHFFEELTQKTAFFMDELGKTAKKHGIPLSTHAVGGMFGFFFTDKEIVTTYQEAVNCDVERFKRFFHGMLREGMYFAPSAFEAGFMSAAHQEADLHRAIAAADRVFATL